MAMPALANIPCPACGMPFKPKMLNANGKLQRQKTCSRTCWGSIRYRLGLAVPPGYRGANRHTCDRCGINFEALRKEPHKYCSKKCWYEAHSIEMARRIGQMLPGRRWNRRDLNEPELIAVVDKLGGFWIEAPPLDGWVHHAHVGGWIPVEIKQPQRQGKAQEFTKAQKRFFAWATACGAQWLVWYTVDDVLRDLGARQTA